MLKIRQAQSLELPTVDFQIVARRAQDVLRNASVNKQLTQKQAATPTYNMTQQTCHQNITQWDHRE
jgi:hypothetical protein